MKINLNGYFEDKKAEIMVKLYGEIKHLENIIFALTNQQFYNQKESIDYKEKISNHELKIIRLRELYMKISNISEEI